MTKREFLDTVFALAPNEANKIMDAFDEYVESAQLGTDLAQLGTDSISRQAAIDLIESIETERLKGNIELIYAPAIKGLRALPPAQPEIKQQAINSSDCIDRRAALDALRKMQTYKLFSGDDMLLIDQAGAQTELMLLPSARPEIVRCKDRKHSDKAL